MQSVMCGSINDGLKRMSGYHIGVVDKYAPEVDEHKEAKVQIPVEREQENEEVVRYRLEVTIYRVECVGCEWCWYYPLMMWFMECLVNAGVMQNTMYPVDGIVCEEKKERYRQDEIGPAVLVDVIVESRVAHDLRLKPRKG